MDRNRHMATRTAHPVDNVHSVSASTQADEALRRARTDQRTEARRMLAAREARHFTAAVTNLTTTHPHPHGPAVRITLTAIDGGEQLDQVDIDVTNLWALAQAATARTNTAPVVSLTAPKPAGSRPALRLLGGGER